MVQKEAFVVRFKQYSKTVALFLQDEDVSKCAILAMILKEEEQ